MATKAMARAAVTTTTLKTTTTTTMGTRSMADENGYDYDG
jgi:hypothetical protein